MIEKQDLVIKKLTVMLVKSYNKYDKDSPRNTLSDITKEKIYKLVNFIKLNY